MKGPDRNPGRSAVVAPSPLPKPLSSFIGRRTEIDELKRIMDSARIVTLTGPGGCGKTRLAIEVATEVSSHFGGAAFVDLSPLQDPATVPETVATGLGLSTETWADAIELIGEASLLLVLDNAEHLLDSVCQLTEELVGLCPNLRILVTTRELLNVAGEVSWRVPPLRLPPEGEPADAAHLAEFDAVQLFTTRAAEHEASFRLTSANAALVVAICRRLEGIPLALELAAARVTSLGLPEIATRLSDSFRLLTGWSRTATNRHRTLRATVDWSYRLLNGPEQCLLRRLALFAGTFDLAAVEAACADPELPVEELADVLHGLVSKSLVTVHRRPDGGLRYALMEAIRQYGQERLLEADETGLRALHARHYATLVDRLETGSDLGDRVDRMAAEYDNVRLALDWAGDEEPDLQVVMMSKLDWFWLVRGTVREARNRILSALAKEHSSADRRARLYAIGAVWCRLAGDLETAMALSEEAVLIVEQLDDPALAARIIDTRGIQKALAGDLPGAERDFSHSLEAWKRLPPSEGLVKSLNNLAMLRVVTGPPEEALAGAEEAIQVLAKLPDRPVWIPEILHTQGAALLMLKRADEARECFLDGLEEAAEYGNYGAAVAVLQGLACCAADSGDPERCLELLAAAQSCARTAGLKEFVAPGTPVPAAERQSRMAVGEGAANQAKARGLLMDLQAALGRARAGLGGDAGSPVTPRKKEVIRLVAVGLGNKEIARRMSISERTVEAHLEQVRNQLGFHNRAQIVAWAISGGLSPSTSSE
jgi:non-specific serine/threonine protein kinase